MPGERGDVPASSAALWRAVAEHARRIDRLERLVTAVDESRLRLEQALTSTLERAVTGTAGGSFDAAVAPSRAVVMCLGEFRVRLDGAPVSDWRPGKSRALFQYLISHHDQPVSRRALIRDLWPDPEATSPASSLKVAVYALRQTLAGVEGEAGPALSVVAHETGYRLQTEQLWLDVEAFEHYCASAHRLEALGRNAEALVRYEQAAALYRGDFLVDCAEEWAAVPREGLIDRYLHVLAKLADAAFASGDYLGCIVRCQQILSRDSCREDAYRTLMLCHAHLGQRSRVRAWYALCVRTLGAELDVRPEPETEILYRRLLAQASSRAVPILPVPPVPPTAVTTHTATTRP
jgi:DNA-binding SARP family transcriptional activator